MIVSPPLPATATGAISQSKLPSSTERAKKANEDGSFEWEIAPVTLPGKAGDTVIKFDEQPFKAKLDKIPGLKPAFKKDGTVTAGHMAMRQRVHVVGDPATVRAGLADLVDRTGADELMITTVAHDPETRIRSYSMVSEQLEM